MGLLVPVSVMAAPPSVGSVSISPDPAYTDTPLTATPSEDWYDEDGDPEGYVWRWQKYSTGISDWEDIADQTDNTLDSLYFIAGDQIKVICTPFDGVESGVDVEATITISNSLPTITGVTIAPDPASTASTLKATPQGWYDADGDLEGYVWRWQKYNTGILDWEDIADEMDNTLDSSNFVLNDQIKVICTPFDGTDEGVPVEAVIVISVLDYSGSIDVKPGSDENPINLGSNGVIAVVIYTTDGFDATTVDVSTVKFGPSEAAPVHYAYEDVDEDGDTDLVLHFRTQEAGISAYDTSVTLTGETDSGTAFTGTDTIKIVPSKAKESVQGNEDAPGQNKEPGESATGKGKNK